MIQNTFVKFPIGCDGHPIIDEKIFAHELVEKLNTFVQCFPELTQAFTDLCNLRTEVDPALATHRYLVTRKTPEGKVEAGVVGLLTALLGDSGLCLCMHQVRQEDGKLLLSRFSLVSREEVAEAKLDQF